MESIKRNRLRIFIGVVLFLIGTWKLCSNGLEIYSRNMYEDCDHDCVGAEISKCETAVEFLGLSENHVNDDSDPVSLSDHEKCAKLTSEWIEIDNHLVVISQTIWYLGVALGIFSLISSVMLLRRAKYSHRLIKVAFSWQILQTVIVILYSCHVIASCAKQYTKIWPQVAESKSALLILNGASIVEIGSSVLACVVFGMLLIGSREIKPDARGGSLS